MFPIPIAPAFVHLKTDVKIELCISNPQSRRGEMPGERHWHVMIEMRGCSFVGQNVALVCKYHDKTANLTAGAKCEFVSDLKI